VTTPGEVSHLIGEAYQYAFVGALEASIPYFEKKFDVRTEPDKTTFRGRSGKDYSFDFKGVYLHPWKKVEVFGECKGYSRARNLLDEFRSFLAKAYVTSVDYSVHRGDYFWFVTNVPFACSEGSGVRSFSYVKSTLKDNKQVAEILGDAHLDDGIVMSLTERLGVFILTDSFLMNSRLSYKVTPGESLWTILKKFHAGQAPQAFGGIAQHIASENKLRSPDEILSGQRILLSWHGIRRSTAEGLPEF